MNALRRGRWEHLERGLLGPWLQSCEGLGLNGGVKRRKDGESLSTISDPVFLQKSAMQLPPITLVMVVRWQITHNKRKYRT